VDRAKEVLDIIQIPAFLCQQTSLLLKVGEAGRAVNIKKGQFVAPENMAGAVKKIYSTGNRQVLLTERGTCFGYNKLISDFCSIPLMQEIGCPVMWSEIMVSQVKIREEEVLNMFPISPEQQWLWAAMASSSRPILNQVRHSVMPPV
jgi:3-deoxy-D-manno-octulosonic acid (KDO) 8-phosphate synthase